MSGNARVTRAIALSAGPNGPIIVTRAEADLVPDLIAAAQAEGVPVVSAPPLVEALDRGETLPGPLVEALLAILTLAEKLSTSELAPPNPPVPPPAADPS